MLKNYLKIAFRHIRQNRGSAFINILGLALGLACCLLIFQYVAYEYSFDAFNANASEIYRVNEIEVKGGEQPEISGQSGYGLGPALETALPEVVRYARIHGSDGAVIITNEAKSDVVFEETSVLFADASFLQMFSYPILKGDASRALAEPGTMLLTEAAAQKYFGAENPIGQVLRVRGRVDGEFRVSGVLEEVPATSHLQFDILLPTLDLLQTEAYTEQDDTGWGWYNFCTYVQFRQDANIVDVNRKATDVLLRYRGDEFKEANIAGHLEAQPLHDVHLNSNVKAWLSVTGSYQTVYFFSLVGLLTLLIALVNYVNLATARALDRAREVGVRKAVGAQRSQLVKQFMIESALTNAIALLLAIGLATLLRPVINSLLDVHLSNTLWTMPLLWGLFLATFAVGTLLAGLYPAFVLSSFRPVTALRGKGGSFTGTLWLRRSLVVLQFTASIVLLVGVAVVYNQLRHMQDIDLGIDLEQVLTVPTPAIAPRGADGSPVFDSLPEALQAFKAEAGRIPAVQNVAASYSLPGRGFSFNSDLRLATADPASAAPASMTWVDTSFTRLYGMDLIAGNGFADISADRPEDEPRPVIANESAIRALGLTEPAEALSRVVDMGGNAYTIAGVMRDFNWSSAHKTRENILLGRARAGDVFSIKVNTENLPQTLEAVEQTYAALFPGNPFRYAFVNEQFAAQYRDDQRFAALFSVFAALAILIACLGLFGLAAFTAQQRTKEIGVRKVLGASVTNLVTLLSKDFMLLVAVAFVIAAPIAYYAMQRWLADFAYRIELSWPIFLIAGLAALLVALLTVSYQAIKAALADPVKSLRYE